MGIKRLIRDGLMGLSTVFLLTSLCAAGETINFGIGKVLDPSINPYNGTYHQRKPRLFLKSSGSNKTVYSVFLEEKDETDYYSHIALFSSADLGQTWSQKTTTLHQSVPVPYLWASYAAAMDDAGNIYVVASDVEAGTGFKYAIFSGGQWTEGTPVNSSMNYYELSISFGHDGTPYLMGYNGGNEIVIYEYVGGSEQWRQTGQLNVANFYDRDFCMDNNNNLYIFGTSYNDVQYYVSGDSGGTWIGPYTLTTVHPSGGQWYIYGVAADVSPAGDIDVSWSWLNDVNQYLYFARRPATAGVDEFASPVRVTEPLVETWGSIGDQRAVYEGNDIYMVWMWEPYYNYGCYEFDFVARSTDGGKSFGKPYRMNWGDYNGECAEHPDMVATKDQQGNTVFVYVWQDDREMIHRQLSRRSLMVYSAAGRLYNEDARVLLVDDDYSEMPGQYALDYDEIVPSNDYHNYEAWHADALFSNGIPYDYIDMAGYGRRPGLNYLNKYEAVVWETGLDYDDGVKAGRNSLTQAEQDLLAGYLVQGGKLFLDSQDFLRDATGGMDGSVYNDFVNNYLSVTDVLNFFDHCDTYYGVSGDPIGDGMTIRTTDTIAYDNPLAGPYNFPFISDINTKRLTHNADTVFTFNGEPVTLRKTEDPYSLVFMAFPFASIDQWNLDPPDFLDNSRDQVMARIMGWLDTAQGWRISRDNAGATRDSYFVGSDWLYISAWSDRVDPASIGTAEAELLKPDNSVITVPLSYNSQTGGFKGSLKLKNEPVGTWTVNRITLSDTQGNDYEINGRYFDLSRSVETFGLNTRWAPMASPYSIGVKVTDESRMAGYWTVDAYYYDVDDPDYVPVLFDTAYVQVSTADGVGTGSVSLDFTGPDFDYGGEYGIYLELSDGATPVAYSYSSGSVAMLDTFYRYPGYSNIAWAMYGDPDQDYDGDGNTNYKEALVGTDPGDPGSFSRPEVAITYPISGSYLGGPACTVTGTAYDSSGKTISAVEVYVEATQSWEAVEGTTNWSYQLSLPPSGSFGIAARAVNDIGYVGSPVNAWWYIDNDAPETWVTDPTDGQYIDAPSYTIKGGSDDMGGYSGPYSMDLVEVSTDGGASWHPATNLSGGYMLWSSWEYVWSPASDGVYNIVTRGTDKAENIETPGVGINVTVDTADPVSAITDPVADGAVNGVTYTITGTASDDPGSGVVKVRLWVDNAWRDATDTSGDGSWSAWSYDWTLPADGTYSMTSAAFDARGRAEEGNFINVTVDNTAPSGGITIAGGAAYTSSPAVTLNLSVSDVGSGEKDMRFSNDGVNWSAWEPYGMTRTWTVGAGPDGVRTVYAEFSDNAGNVSATCSDAIMLDTTGPVSLVTDPAPGAALRYVSYAVSGVSDDNGGSNVAFVEVSTDGGANWYQLPEGTTSWSYDWTLPSDGVYTLMCRATDNIGNTGPASAGVTVTVDNGIPVSAVMDPLDGAVIQGTTYTITGTSSDGGGSGVGLVMVSVDSATWNNATDTSGNGTWATWSYEWTVPADGPQSLMSAAVDKAGNLEEGTFIYVMVDNSFDISRASVDGEGTEADGPSIEPSVSADGRYVAFQTAATNMDNFGTLDTNGVDDVYVVDRLMSVTKRVSEDPYGNDGNGASTDPVISADGRYVAFVSAADNLVPGDTNGKADIYVHDMTTDNTVRVSVDCEGAQSDGDSYAPSISADGRYVAFHTGATNLDNFGVPDTNGLDDVYVAEWQGGIIWRVSEDPYGNDGNGMSNYAVISADGRYVAFASLSDNMVPGDTNAAMDIFLHDMTTGVTERVSVDDEGAQANADSFFPSINADGSIIAFHTLSNNLDTHGSADTNGLDDVYVVNRLMSVTRRVSEDPSDKDGNSMSIAPAISGDGRYVAFISMADNIVPGDTNGVADVFVRDLVANETARVSINAQHVEADNECFTLSISQDGQYVAFGSNAANLVPGDTNGTFDIFVAENPNYWAP